MRYLVYIFLLNIVFMENIDNKSDGKKDFAYIGNWPINSDKNSIIKNSNTNKLT